MWQEQIRLLDSELQHLFLKNGCEVTVTCPECNSKKVFMTTENSFACINGKCKFSKRAFYKY